MSSIPELLALAFQHHQTGDLQQAETLYRQILQAAPDHADALHLLGLIAHRAGNTDVAVQYIRRAIQSHPASASFHNNLAVSLEAQGKWAEAAEHYRRAVELQPDFADAFYNLGNALAAQRQWDEAMAAYRKALQLKPGLPEAHNNLGIALRETGQAALAKEHYEQAARLRPGFVEALHNLGTALKDLGRPAEAVTRYQEALRLRPDFAEAHANLGNVLELLGRRGEAVAHLRESLRLRPDHAEARYNLGNALFVEGHREEAVACYREAVRLRPDFAEARVNLGNALQDQGQFAEASNHYREALRARPDFAEAHANLGNALLKQGELIDATRHYQEALREKPDLGRAQYFLAMTLAAQGRFQEARSYFQEALRLEPDDAEIRTTMLFALCHDPGICPDELFAEHRRWGELHGGVVAPIPPPGNDPAPERRIRVGYVSADFRRHAVACFIEPILAHHDPARVETTCYADFADADEVTERLRGLAQRWRMTRGLTDEALADLVRTDAIDILVDLAGHTSGNRLRMFAHRPAPLQVTYLGYPHTTGLRAIDYRLTDAVIDPPGEPVRSVEEPLRLAGGIACFAPRDNAPEVTPLSARRNGAVTFGSLHKLTKLNDDVLNAWCRILHALPAARLFVARDTLKDPMQEELRRRFAERGIPTDRLTMEHATPAGPGGYLRYYAGIDISLDTFPWSGHTVTCESLWMGVPVVTCYGDRQASRMAASVLTHAGLREFIGDSVEAFIARAVELAGDLDRLERLRASLRERLRASPVCDGAGCTRGLEDAYRTIWRGWCARSQF